MTTKSGFIIAAPHSGAGKTTITLALLAALKNKGLKVQPFKCGPDFIDPTLHKLVTGTVSRNLDLKMCGDEFVKSCYRKEAGKADVTVIEGVMGLFDGGRSSCAALAKSLALPVILTIDVKGAAESVAAVVKGFELLDPDIVIAGVILNRIGSPRHLELVSASIKKHCRAEILGYLPRDLDFAIPGRHLGLQMGDENPLNAMQLAKMAEAVQTHIDLDKLLKLTKTVSQKVEVIDDFHAEDYPKKTTIAVARDEAFCFYYEDNLEMLRKAGANLVFFSPLRDKGIPAGAAGLYLGGGYPELYAEELSNNQAMLAAIKDWSDSNQTIFAECGGFIYLCAGITNPDGGFFQMANVFPANVKLKNRLASLGYRRAQITAPSCLGSGGNLYGHEFHYSEIDEMPGEVKRVFQLADGRMEGYMVNNTLAGYIHFHFGRSFEAARYFVNFCHQTKKLS